jgi:hypothetical protein
MNTNACDQRELMFKIFVSHLQLLLMNISFVAMTCIAHSHIYVSVRVVSVAVKSFFTWTHIYPADGYVHLQWQDPHLTAFIPAKT